MQSTNITIVICHFGKLPWYFEYFVTSCRYNPTVNFLIIYDDDTYDRLVPENVKMIYKTLEDFNKLATAKLGFNVEVTKPYKICDFKPAFGLLFSEALEAADFWGYGDIDVIFGNIRNFITDELMAAYDVISVRHDYLTGYFQLFRNVQKMTMLFTNSKDYRRVLQSADHFCFDETNFTFDAFREGLKWNEIESDIESMMHVVKRLEEQGEITAFFDFYVIEGLPGKIRWEKGKLIYFRQFEILLYHMIFFKNVYKPKKRPLRIPDTFTISPTKIYHKKVMPQ